MAILKNGRLRNFIIGFLAGFILTTIIIHIAKFIAKRIFNAGYNHSQSKQQAEYQHDALDVFNQYKDQYGIVDLSEDVLIDL